jgi:hypothetical protein
MPLAHQILIYLRNTIYHLNLGSFALGPVNFSSGILPWALNYSFFPLLSFQVCPQHNHYENHWTSYTPALKTLATCCLQV